MQEPEFYDGIEPDGGWPGDRGAAGEEHWKTLLAGPEGEDIRLAVKHGARFLEEKGAVNWAENILEANRMGEFCMSEGPSCAVGVTLGSYYDYFTDGLRAFPGGEGSKEEAVAMGFMAPGTVNDDDWYPKWAALEQAWVDYAEEQA